jgi:hypothetical protein
MKRRRNKTQPRVPGLRRRQVSTALNAKIERAVEREMAHFRASRSYVIAVAVAHTLGVELDDEEDYR